MPFEENKTILISVVSPIYQAENIVDELVLRITDQVKKITDNYELILIEDGSPDKSWDRIEENCLKNPKVKGIKLSKNFGQHYAITAGLCESTGQFVVVMDCDLQDNPMYISELYKQALKGYDIVYTVKEKRKHPFLKNIFATFFFAISNYLAEGSSARSDIGAYSLLSRKVVESFCKIKDTHRHYLLILKTLGYKSGFITIVHEPRFLGKSSYTFSKLVKHAIDGIASQSGKLLRISVSLGFFIFMISIIWALYLVILYYSRGARAGYTSVMVLLLLSTGLILMSIGIMGIYIGKIFEQVKERPLYFIDKKMNF